MFSVADKDEDGKINYDEFLLMITPMKVREGTTKNVLLGGSQNQKIQFAEIFFF